MSDEIISMNKGGNPAQLQNHKHHANSGVSKFDRYKHQEDEDDDEMDEGNLNRKFGFHS